LIDIQNEPEVIQGYVMDSVDTLLRDRGLDPNSFSSDPINIFVESRFAEFELSFTDLPGLLSTEGGTKQIAKTAITDKNNTVVWVHGASENLGVGSVPSLLEECQRIIPDLKKRTIGVFTKVDQKRNAEELVLSAMKGLVENRFKVDHPGWFAVHAISPDHEREIAFFRQEYASLATDFPTRIGIRALIRHLSTKYLDIVNRYCNSELKNRVRDKMKALEDEENKNQGIMNIYFLDGNKPRPKRKQVEMFWSSSFRSFPTCLKRSSLASPQLPKNMKMPSEHTDHSRTPRSTWKTSCVK